jgi:hypothetical protein
MQNCFLLLKIEALFIVMSLFSGCCNKKSETDVPEVINYNIINGIMAFSGSLGKIIVLDGFRNTCTTLTSQDESNIWGGSVCFSPDGENITC